MTPDQVHYGQADEVHATRQKILDRAFRDNPNRFVNKAPQPPQKPTAVWINPPALKLQVDTFRAASGIPVMSESFRNSLGAECRLLEAGHAIFCLIMRDPQDYLPSPPIDLGIVGRRLVEDAILAGERAALEAAVRGELADAPEEVRRPLLRVAAVVGDHIAQTAAALRMLQQTLAEARRTRGERLRIDPLPEIVARHGIAYARPSAYGISVNDGAFVGRGWHSLETDSRGYWLWSGPESLSSVLLPALGGGQVGVDIRVRLPFGGAMVPDVLSAMLDGVPVTCNGVRGDVWSGVARLPTDDGASRMALVLASRLHEDPRTTPDRDVRVLGVGLVSVRVEKRS